MKKAISITLNGIVFMIEEDALQRLSSYFDSIKAHYGEDGDEITKDIEADIADRFKAKNGGRQKLIMLSDVEEIIKVMGTVNQIEEENENVGHLTEEKENSEENKNPKRLYRDGDGAILGGVCSGLGIYFSIDPVVFRLLFVALTLVNGAGILIYIIFWLAVPMAKTSVQKLEMQGESINLKNIEEALREKSQVIKEKSQEAFVSLKKQKSLFAKIFSLPIILIEGLLKFCKSIFKVALPIARISFGLFLVFGIMFSFVFASFWLVILLFKTNSPLLETDFPIELIANTKAYFVTIISSYIAFIIPMFATMLLAVSVLRRKNLFNWIIVTILIATWVLNITVVCIFGFDLVSNFKTVREDYINKNTVEKIIEVSDFNAISGDVRGSLKIEKAENFSVSVKGLNSDIEKINFSKEATTTEGLVNLKITQENNYNHGGFLSVSQPIEIVIKMPDLVELDARDFYRYEFNGFSHEPKVIGDQEGEEELNSVSSERDEHGCVSSAGYRWCEGEEKCFRPWDEVCETEINFSQSGMTVKNLPGLKEDQWYLLYEEPGNPALNAELQFDMESRCGNDKRKIMCTLLSNSDYGMENGKKAEIRGTELDGVVKVRELIFEEK
ncbi:MAG: PspC domain-containing protein [Candidatus Magasanikbacteria bacterium]|nr:PspC domain-containing protein [Candidatus Magasanikbacteria bacterium]